MPSRPKDVEYTRRGIASSAGYSIRDIYEVLVELITNSDDRYCLLRTPGRIEIEVERGRKGNPSLLRVRDFADGMTDEDMEAKLRYVGGRVSGQEGGGGVRGTHSRGAKDIACLGTVTFECIAAKDGRYHKCEITPFFKFVSHDSRDVTPELREAIGIADGTGTLVSVEVETGKLSRPFPQHDTLRERLRNLVLLREILRDKERCLILRDLRQEREDEIASPPQFGEKRISERLKLAKYPAVEAKLTIRRAGKRFEKDDSRFRQGGILVVSKRAVHEATLFDSKLENDPNAAWFFGRLVCEHIDTLHNEYWDRWDRELTCDESNPTQLLDPNRRVGLIPDHPFTKALYGEALRHLRPLVDQEREREKGSKPAIASRDTRRMLDDLEKAAAKFMQEFGDEDEPVREPDSTVPESRFRERGFALSPPFTQMVVGHSQKFWLSVSQRAFPELPAGAPVRIEALSPEIVSDRSSCGLDPHPTRLGVLRAMWTVKALEPTPAAGLQARVVGSDIKPESTIAVLSCEADRYAGVDDLRFSKQRYRMRTNQKRKKLRLLAPLTLVTKPATLAVSSDNPRFRVSGQTILSPVADLGVAVCDLAVKLSGEKEGRATIRAALGDREASAVLRAVRPAGFGLKFDIDYAGPTDQRYVWQQTERMCIINAEHSSLSRYLGPKDEGFPGQKEPHFRLLIAEIVADAICCDMLSRRIENEPELYEGGDWDTFYSAFWELMREFLPVAHRIVCPEFG